MVNLSLENASFRNFWYCENLYFPLLWVKGTLVDICIELSITLYKMPSTKIATSCTLDSRHLRISWIFLDVNLIMECIQYSVCLIAPILVLDPHLENEYASNSTYICLVSMLMQTNNIANYCHHSCSLWRQLQTGNSVADYLNS